MFDHVESPRIAATTCQCAIKCISSSSSNTTTTAPATATTLTSSKTAATTTTASATATTLCGVLCFWHLAEVATSSPHFPRDSPIETGLGDRETTRRCVSLTLRPGQARPDPITGIRQQGSCSSSMSPFVCVCVCCHCHSIIQSKRAPL